MDTKNESAWLMTRVISSHQHFKITHYTYLPPTYPPYYDYESNVSSLCQSDGVLYTNSQTDLTVYSNVHCTSHCNDDTSHDITIRYDTR